MVGENWEFRRDGDESRDSPQDYGFFDSRRVPGLWYDTYPRHEPRSSKSHPPWSF